MSDINKELFHASEAGDATLVRQLIEAGADTDKHQRIQHGGEIALHAAASNGNIEVLRILLEAGADVKKKDHYGWTALHTAARNGHDGLVKILIEAGSDVSNVNGFGWTALHRAALQGHDRVVIILIEAGSDVNIQNKYGHTALYYAAVNGHDGVVKILIEYGADVNKQDKDGETALHRTACPNPNGLVKIPAGIEAGGDVYEQERDWNTAHHRAAEIGQGRVMVYLMEAGADPYIPDRKGKTPIEVGRDKIVGLEPNMSSLDSNTTFVCSALRNLKPKLDEDYNEIFYKYWIASLLVQGKYDLVTQFLKKVPDNKKGKEHHRPSVYIDFYISRGLPTFTLNIFS